MRITDENIDLANEIIISCLKELMMSKRNDPSLDPQQLNQKLLQMIRYIIGYEQA